MYGCFAVSRRNCRRIVRLWSFPKEFLLVVIQLITELAARFDHHFVQVMSKFTIEWHESSLRRESLG